MFQRYYTTEWRKPSKKMAHILEIKYTGTHVGVQLMGDELKVGYLLFNVAVLISLDAGRYEDQ